MKKKFKGHCETVIETEEHSNLPTILHKCPKCYVVHAFDEFKEKEAKIKKEKKL